MFPEGNCSGLELEDYPEVHIGTMIAPLGYLERSGQVSWFLQKPGQADRARSGRRALCLAAIVRCPRSRRTRDLFVGTSSRRTRLGWLYLRGSVECARCHRRLIVHNAKGNGGVYPYFICSGRHNHVNDCELPAVRIDTVEDLIIEEYRKVAIPASMIDQLEERLLQDFEDASKDVRARQRDLGLQRERLENKRRMLLDAHMAGAVPLDLLKEQQSALTLELSSVNERLSTTQVQTDSIRATLASALELARDCYEAYRGAPDHVRRMLNQAFFERIEVEVIDADTVVSVELAEPFRSLSARSRPLPRAATKNHRPAFSQSVVPMRLLWWIQGDSNP